MLRFFHGSIRKKLVILVLMATLPPFVVLAFNEMAARRHTVEMAGKDTATLLRGYTEVQRRVADSTRTLLQTVAALPAVQTADPGGVYSLLAALISANPIYTNAFLLDMDGRVVAGSLPGPHDFDFSDRKHVIEAKQTGAFAAGEFVVGRAILKPIFPFAMPVYGPLGEMRGILIIGADLSHFGELFDQASFPPGSFLGICDHAGRRLFRHPASDATPPGTPIRDEVFLAASQADGPGIIRAKGSDGPRRIVAYEQVRLGPDQPPYMYMFMGFRESEVLRQVNDQAVLGGVTIAVSLALALLLAWYAGGRTLARNLEKLTEAACRVGSSGTMQSSGIDYNDGEMGQLGKAFDTMGRLLEEREAERNEALNRLSESEEQYRTLLENNPAGICLVDPNTMTIEFANPAFLRLLGLGPEDVGAIRVSDIHPPEDLEAVSENFLRHSRQDVSFSAAVPCLTRSGEHILVDISSARVRVYGRVLLAGFFTDITERKRFEDALVVAKEAAEQANMAKDEFLANISHEVRTPLNGVMGMLQLIRASATGGEQRGYVDMAIQSSRNLLRVLNDVLDFSKIEAGKLDLYEEPFDLDGLMRQCASLFRLQADEKGLSLEHRIDSSARPCYIGDEGRIRQVLFNLLGNAIKFTASGSIILEAYALPHREPGHERLFFSVTDTGSGIPDSKVNYIFDAFTQVDGSLSRKYQGVGLGLPIVKRLVRLMNGSIVVDSELGVGTTVLFNVKVRVPERGICARIEPEESAAAANPLRILLVEDERVNMLMAKRLLESLGHAVTCAENGEKCLEILRHDRFDVILMDIQMPVMNGMEVTRLIRTAEDFRHVADIPIVALTAHATPRDREAALEAGMNDYVSKPFEKEHLEATIQRVAAG
ncbi:response regulator [Pseudodesulfovibrio pelocollis]|uniref:response regulator n=1 Tax=Pseudodesulfovibrio pelocollis TaxID=3051432 RepID=UPI00255B1BED|nr:response regulator [Pseudodesulfovibrio sp. SB368]